MLYFILQFTKVVGFLCGICPWQRRTNKLIYLSRSKQYMEVSFKETFGCLAKCFFYLITQDVFNS
jgi:hypothetical protein